LNGSAAIKDCEIEAPNAACVGVYASRETVISNLTYAQAAGVTNPFAIEIDASCTSFVMDGFINTQDAGAVLTSTIKDNRANKPLYWGNTGASAHNTPLLTDNVFIGTAGYYIQNQQRQLFNFVLANNGGTIQHRIGSLRDAATDSAYSNRIANATATYTTTPTGTDSSTAFAAGAKISSANVSIVIFNTATQQIDDWSGRATIINNSTGTALNVAITTNSFDVNGVTRNYLILQFSNATTGGVFDLTTISSGKSIVVSVDVFLT